MKNLRLELTFRALAAIGLSIFVVGAYAHYRASGDLPVLLLLIGESLTVALIVAARTARVRSTTPVALVLTMACTYYFLFISFEPGPALVPMAAGEALQVCGIVMQIASKLHLGRSFGLLPANRGIVSSGPYRLVRHPIYLGYFLAHLGYLLYAFTPGNLALFALLYSLQAARAIQEEKLLLADARYCRYAARVRWHFIPYVF